MSSELDDAILSLNPLDLKMLIKYFMATANVATTNMFSSESNNPVVVDLRSKTLGNDDFRYTLTTGMNSQLVMMCLKPGENIGMETHSDVDQIFYVVKGSGKCIIDNVEHFIASGFSIFVKAGVEHDIINDATNGRKLKLFTVYSPPEHPPGTIRKFK